MQPVWQDPLIPEPDLEPEAERGSDLAAAEAVHTDHHVLMDGDTLGVIDPQGNLRGTADDEHGLYHLGTRHLHKLVLSIAHQPLSLLSSRVTLNNIQLSVDLMNDDLLGPAEAPAGRGPALPKGTFHVRRSILLLRGVWHEQIDITNYGLQSYDIPLTLELGGDFRDIFEVRGLARNARGECKPQLREESGPVYEYLGLDGVTRQTRVVLDPPPQYVDTGALSLAFRIGPGETKRVRLTITCVNGEPAKPVRFEQARREARLGSSALSKGGAQIRCSSETYSVWFARSRADLNMMCVRTEDGPFPYAGVPWFSAPFGRDALITALSTLWMAPNIARGVLAHLARLQSTETNAAMDAEPGKILHESRHGEMCALGEVPFARYYGSVDSTPLFVMLAGRYLHVTGDVQFVQRLLPNVQAALRWIDEFGDRDGDGFLEYHRQAADGLVQQGWKDSSDSVFHADGTGAISPIALCEVQGYVYAARRGAAEIFDAVGHHDAASLERARAEKLRAAFDASFWCEDIGTYALALDRDKRACRVRTSNPGHCLLTDIALPERVPALRQQLTAPDMFTGWGIRTLSSLEKRYNPMSYHNGSVWPHDTAMAAAGLARYGECDAALVIVNGLLALSRHVPLYRLPELLCGFPRARGEGPTLYPVACSPQAWAAAAPFLALQAVLGLDVDARRSRVTFRNPVLPETLRQVVLCELPVGKHRVDLELVKNGDSVSVNPLRCPNDVEVLAS
ncbi:MAG TPA: glycogen debranching N-terminal domain-containing protein [Polyangiaceae bacterium]